MNLGGRVAVWMEIVVSGVYRERGNVRDRGGGVCVLA